MTGLLDILGLISFLAIIIFAMIAVRDSKKGEMTRRHWVNIALSFVVMIIIAWLRGNVS